MVLTKKIQRDSFEVEPVGGDSNQELFYYIQIMVKVKVNQKTQRYNFFK